MVKRHLLALCICLVASFLVVILAQTGQSNPTLDNYQSRTTSPAVPESSVSASLDPREELWNIIDRIGDPLRILFRGNYAADFDDNNNQVIYSIWLESITLETLDAALLNNLAYDSWCNITDSLCERSIELQDAFNRAGLDEITVVLNLVEFNDFEILCASASRGNLIFDLVDSTPPGERLVYLASAGDFSAPKTFGQENALRSACSYLSFTAFSWSGLVKQLEFDGYTHDEAVFAANACGADWNEQAAKRANSYLQLTGFSRSSLIEQLEFDGFTYEQALYGVVKAGY